MLHFCIFKLLLLLLPESLIISYSLSGRIQTGKLSEFFTTSCFAHLSFMDGKTASSQESHEGSDDGKVHDFRCDDGKNANHAQQQPEGRTT